MKIYFTSDLHFGHFRVLEYCNRPFTTLDEMHAKIISVWNDTVKPEDTVYVIGDFSLNHKWSKEIVPLLNGEKILIAGNHDACFIHKKKQEKAIRMRGEYYTHGWSKVYNEYHMKGSRTVELPFLGLEMSHFPFMPPKGVDLDLRYREYRPVDRGQILLQGHLHGRYIKNGRQIDVGWDAHNGKLVSLDEIEALIKDEREFIPSHITEFYKTRSQNEKTDSY